MRIQTNLKAGSAFGRAAAGNASPQVVVELLRNQPLFEQGLIPAHLLPQRGLPQKSLFKCRDIIGVLSVQRVQRIAHVLPAMLDDFPGDFRQTLLENRVQTLLVEAHQPLDEQPRYQQELDPVGQPVSKKPLDSEIPVKEIGGTESRRKRERSCRSSRIAEPALGA